MKLEKVIINNFCSCQSVELDLDGYSPIVGYNNSGKSNILKAINWLLRKSVLPQSSFFDANTAITVEGEISNVDLQLLPQNQQQAVAQYLNNNILKFRRRQDIPQTTAAQIKIDVYDFNANNWVANPAGLDNALAVLFPEPIYIEAMKDASDDIGKFSAKNTIGLLLKYILEQIRQNNAVALQSLESALLTVESHLSGQNRINEFSTFETQATSAINNFFPGISLHLNLAAPTLDDLIKSASIDLSEQAGQIRNFSSYGHGAQRSVQMALIQLLAIQVQSLQLNLPTVVLLIDEPELYLHPQAIEILRESLVLLSSQNFQIIFSTHSPLLVNQEQILSTSIVVKEQNQTKVRQKLSAVTNVLNNNAHQTSTIFSLQHSTYLLFSEKVFIVEGKTEKVLLPDIYRTLIGRTIGHDKTCMIEAGGGDSVYPIMRVLSQVGYKPKAIVDLDYIFKKAPNEQLIDQQTNQDFIDCKAWFQQNHVALGFFMGADGFPCKGGTMSVTAAFETLATNNNDKIVRLASILLAENIWVWKRGAIEAHIGIQKNDNDRMSFLHTTKTNLNVNHATDSQSIIDLINWI
jgi:putative ATP-dependent endonuclease of the OLD family